MENSSIEYSVVIPVYNSEKTLVILYERLKSVFQSISDTYEIIMVDDCSYDKSWEILEKLYVQDYQLKIIRLMKNTGQHNALLCGLNHVSGRYIITMDDDLQYPPEEIPKLVDAIKKNPEMDAIIGKPLKKAHNIFRNFLSWIYNLFNSYILNRNRDFKISSFTIIKREIIDEIVKKNSYSATIGSKLLSITMNIENVTVDHHKSLIDSSRYSTPKLISLSLDNILYYSTFPLKLVNMFGITISLLSVVCGIYIVFKKLFFGIPVSGWTSLMVVNLFLFGVVLFALGIIGEYLIRIIHTSSNESLYVIRTKKL